MTIKNRLYLAALLTPAFWLVLQWVFYVSGAAVTMNYVHVLFQSLAISFVCSYCVTLYIAAFRCRENKSDAQADK